MPISTEQPTDGTLWIDISEVPDAALVPSAVGVPDGYVAEGYGRFLGERLLPEFCDKDWPDRLPGPPVDRIGT